MNGVIRRLISMRDHFFSSKSRITSPPTPASGELHDIPLTDTSGPMDNLLLERFLFAIEGTSDGLYWGVPSGERWWSKGFRELIGYSEDELPASYESWVSLLHPDDRNDVLESLEDHFEKGVPYNIEYRLRTKNRGYRWVLARGASQMGKEGRPTLTAGSIHDITDLKLAQDGQQESEERYRDLYDNAPDMFASIDAATGAIVECNNTLVEATGYSREEIIGFHASMLYHPDSEAARQKIFQTFVEGGDVHDAELQLLRKDGGTIDVSLNISSIRDKEGKVVRSRSVWRDITKHKQAEERATRFSRVLEDSLNEICIFDAESLRFVEVNRGARENLGYTADELRSMTPLDLKPEFTAESLAELIQPLRDGAKETIEFETVHRRKDGSRYPVEVRLQLMRDGSPVFVAIIHDIIERKRAEDRLRLTQFSIDHNFNPIYRIKSDGSICYVNQAASRTLGYTHDELLAMTVPDIDPNFPEEAWPAHWREMKQAGSMTFEARHKTKDGRVFPVEIQSNFLSYGGEEYIWAYVRDLREKKTTEKNLRASEERFRKAFDCSPIGMAIVSPSGAFLDVNEVLCETIGYSAGELLALDFQSITHPDDLEGSIQMRERLLSGADQRIHTEKRYIHKKGHTIWARLSVALVTDEEGTPQIFLSQIEDLSDRVEADQRLHAAEAQSREVLETAADAIVTINRKGVIELFNPAASEMFGYGQEEVIDRNIRMLMPEPDRTKHDSYLARYVDTGEKRIIGTKREVIARKKNGRHFPVELSISEAWTGGEATFTGIVRDITERKLAEDQMREHAALVEIAPSAILLLNLDDTVKFCNRATEEIYGWSGEELLGQRWDELAFDSESRGYYDLKESTLSEGSWHGELNQVHRSGRELALDAHAVLLRDDSDRPRSILLVCNDITERVKAEEDRARLEEQMQQTQKLESLGVLAGGIAHDFNNLLAAILGNADLALNELSPTSRARSYLNDIVASSERAADLSRQMLAYSGRGRFVLEALSLNALVHEIGQLLKTIIGKKVSLQYDLMRDLPLVEGDATQIRQILMNLVTNASEAIGEDPGTISISTGLRTCNSEFLAATWLNENLPAGEYVYFEFADTGCGMNQADLEKMFDPFFTTKFTGRGLGLAATLGIVRGHRGAVNVESTLGEGTRFTVFLPRSDSSEPPADMKESANSVKSQQYTVLLVDDEPFVLKTASSILQKAGYTVLTAIDGRKALDVYNEHGSSIGCVLLDLTMPEMDGEETFDELRQLGCEVPILLCSGFDSEETAERFGGKDVAGFLQKPYRMEELLGKLSAALGP